MLLSELRGISVRSIDGKRLGKVHEVHCDHGRIVAVMVGPASFIERWTSRSRGRRIPWKAICRVDRDGIVLNPERNQE